MRRWVSSTRSARSSSAQSSRRRERSERRALFGRPRRRRRSSAPRPAGCGPSSGLRRPDRGGGTAPRARSRAPAGGLQVELVRRAEAPGDPRAGDQLRRCQPGAAQPPRGAALRGASEPTRFAEDRVEQIQTARDVDRHRLEILIGPPAPPAADGRPAASPATATAAPATTAATRADRAREHQRRRPPRPVLRRPRTINPSFPARPPLGLHALPALLQRLARRGVEDRDQRPRRLVHGALALRPEGQRVDERTQTLAQQHPGERRVAQRREVQHRSGHASRSLPAAASSSRTVSGSPGRGRCGRSA